MLTVSGNNTISITPYTSKDRAIWDNYVSSSKNGVFLFNRNYMEYHADRFKDHSLMFYRKGQLAGLMPANINGDTLYSHQGLTFGGLIAECSTKTAATLQIFDALINHCKSIGIKALVYKTVPYIYHQVPANEDLYALFRNNAKLIARNASTCIYMPSLQAFSGKRVGSIKKAQKQGIVVKQSTDFDTFMGIVAEALSERHNTKPVHTAEEMVLLANRFPDNIKMYGAFKGEQMLAGVIIYESRNVAHTQYAANSKEGRSLGAQDLVEDYLIKEVYKSKLYYDFGISTEQMGQVLNFGLIARKEAFNAGSVMYDIYQINL